MDVKKKRGCNYTVGEKDILLELVRKYQNLIENKETNATIILKKRDAWESVCQQYNAVAASGLRTWQQLRHLYENIKQRSRKNVAKDNRLQFYEKTRDIKDVKFVKDVKYSKDVKDVKIKATVDKKEINRTGGGSYKSTLTDHDSQILAMVAPQIKPISNPYDDAALYFGDTDSDDKYKPEVIELSSDKILNETDYTESQVMDDITVAVNSKPCTVTSHPADITMTTTEMHKPSTSAPDLTDKVKTKSNIKDQYFKAKLRNAKLEYKSFINKNKMEMNKYKLEMQILELRLKRLQSSKINK